MLRSEDKGIYEGRPYSGAYSYEEADFLEFKENGEYRRYNDNTDHTGTWKLEGNKLSLYNPGWEETYINGLFYVVGCTT